MTDVMVSAAAIAASALALSYCELRGWRGLTRFTVYLGVCVMAVELGATPLIHALFATELTTHETYAWILAYTAGLVIVFGEVMRWSETKTLSHPRLLMSRPRVYKLSCRARRPRLSSRKA